jgi:hypothetical protein
MLTSAYRAEPVPLDPLAPAWNSATALRVRSQRSRVLRLRWLRRP